MSVLTNRTQRVWGEKKVVGALFMDFKLAFNNVSKSHLGRRMEALETEPDIIRWAGSLMSDRQVKLVLDGKTGKASPVDTGIPQGRRWLRSSSSRTSGIPDEVEAVVPDLRSLFFVDDIGWWADGGGGG